MTPCQEGDLQLGTDAVATSHQHRIAPTLTIQSEETAESADFGQHVAVERAPSQSRDALLGTVSSGDVHAGRGGGGRFHFTIGIKRLTSGFRPMASGGGS